MLQPGQIIGDMYRIERLLGSGGMADVYVVKHIRLPKHFALKVMRLESGERSGYLERFRREAEILATLKNAHLVEVFDRNETPDGNPYLIMELLEGEDLAQFLTRSGGALSVATALSICNQVGEALDAAHQVGIVHRDLKPSNIFLCQREAFPNFVKVLDFGIAKQTHAGRTPLTADRALMGTPGYMAPEQALGKTARIDHRTDQFALASILYEMLAGKPAFYQAEDTTFAILTRVVHGNPPPLPHQIIQRAVQRALSKNPEERFPSIKAFLAAAGANNLTIHMAPSVPEAVKSTTSNGELTINLKRQPRTLSKRVTAAILSIGIGGMLAAGSGLAVSQWRLKPGTVAQLQPEPPSSPTARVTEPSEPAVDEPKSREGSETPERPTTSTAEASADPAGPATKPPAPPRPRPIPSVPRSYVMTGVAGIQEKLLQQCAQKELNGISSLSNQVIKLERSGVLQITEAPSAVYETNFGYCIRKVFSRSDMVLPIPQAVTIRIRGR
jgi:serine/threonine protein kinase